MPSGLRWSTIQAQEWAEQVRGVDPKTRKAYSKKAVSAWRALVRLGHPEPFGRVTARAVEDLARDKSLAPTTRELYLFALQGAVRFAGNPVADDSVVWRHPAAVPRRPRWPSLAEMAKILGHARDDRARLGIALLACGLREDELVRLRQQDLIQTGSGWAVEFYGKREKLRHVDLTEQAVDALLPIVGGLGPTDKLYGYRRSRIWKDVSLACGAAGLPHYSPHDLRHGFAREYMRAAQRIGIPYDKALLSLQRLMGHDDPGQTLRYIGAEEEVARRGVDALAAAMKGIA